jgi:catechol 2,3-dioxygenase
MSIDPATHIGAVHLTIADLSRSLQFYESRLGLELHRRDGDTAWLGPDGTRTFLVLSQDASATRARGTTGLYHFAILVPSRRDLAIALRRLVQTSTGLQGFADHGVSEAIYLADPDGNGIEIYRDRPRAEWPIVDGQLRMGIDSLDVDELLSEGVVAESDTHRPMPEGTTMGHVHLHVSNLEASRWFYVDVLGFDLMQRYGPSALFVSAGGYHHHVGLNTWAGVGAPPPDPGALGLRHFEVVLPNREGQEAIKPRLAAADVDVEESGDALFVRDPSQNGVMLTVAE